MSIVLSIRHYTEYKALYRCPVCFYFTFQAWHFLDLMTSFYTVSQKWFGTLILPHASTYFDNFWQKCCREGNLSSGDFFSKLLKLLMYIKVVVSHISVFLTHSVVIICMYLSSVERVVYALPCQQFPSQTTTYVNPCWDKTCKQTLNKRSCLNVHYTLCYIKGETPYLWWYLCQILNVFPNSFTGWFPSKFANYLAV